MKAGSGCPPSEFADARASGPVVMESWHGRCETVRQLRLDSERAFRLARAGCRKFFDELNDLGWDLQLQAQKVEREAQESEIKS